MMTTTADEMASQSLNDLKQLLHAVEARIVLCEATGNDPEERAKLDERLAEIQQRILERGGDAPRLPYGDPD